MRFLLRWQTWAFTFLFWTAYAILDSAGSFAIMAALKSKPVISSVLLWNFAQAYVWVLFTPLICAIAAKYTFNRYTWKKSLAVHVPVSLALTALVSWLLLLIQPQSATPFAARFLHLGLQHFPRCLVTMGLAHAIAYYARFREREIEAARLESRLAQAQLEILRSQLDPHFLFNALNSIATLSRRDPASAERMTLQLASLLRTSLESAGAQEIPLQQEIGFLSSYLEIQQTRFQDRLTINVNIDPALLSEPVPSLILQPLVENAIRHGITKSAGPGNIDITAARDNGSIKIEISDNGLGMHGNPAAEKEGFGLRNTRARLKQLYGDQHLFRLENSPGGGCRVTLSIPLPRNRKAVT